MSGFLREAWESARPFEGKDGESWRQTARTIEL